MLHVLREVRKGRSKGRQEAGIKGSKEHDSKGRMNPQEAGGLEII
jgi:hypothetical protein